jgi:hypothetical protein
MFRLDPSVLAVVLMEETWSVDKSPRRGKGKRVLRWAASGVLGKLGHGQG